MRVGSPSVCENRRSCRTRRRRLRRTRTIEYHRDVLLALCVAACSDRAAVVLALLGMGAAAADVLAPRRGSPIIFVLFIELRN